MSETLLVRLRASATGTLALRFQLESPRATAGSTETMYPGRRNQSLPPISILRGDALDAQARPDGQSLEPGDAREGAAAGDISVGHRHERLRRPRPLGRDPVRLARVDEVRATEKELHRRNLPEGLEAQDHADAAVTGLNRLIDDARGGRSRRKISPYPGRCPLRWVA